ncbi:MAG: hypothetical protein JKX92_11110 [Porticoccaceae bacterium]|nr:hypothetical protein [Porticoccaceae bacterium]
MSNHYPVVLHINAPQAEHLSDPAVIMRLINEGITRQANHPQQQQEISLICFAGNPRQYMPYGRPCRLSDYLELVD